MKLVQADFMLLRGEPLLTDRPARPKGNRQSKLKGEAHPGAKLTWLQVLEIRTATGVQKAVANQYGITNSTVSRIKSRKKWGWLPEEGDLLAPANDPYPETINEVDLEFEQTPDWPRSARP